MFTQVPDRIPAHLRDVSYRTFLRPDGHWDIEGTLEDTKGYAQTSTERGYLPAGAAIHHMGIRLTIDDNFKVLAVEVGMPVTPFDECQGAKPPVDKLVGASIGSGWRKVINEAMGRELGCTHLRELLFGMGTAAVQTVERYRAHERRLAGKPEPVRLKPPPHLGQCISWAFDSGPVKRHQPNFYGWQPVPQASKDPA